MIVETSSYGICLFSVSCMLAFLKENKKSRNKRLLDLFQENHSLYVKTLEQGVWLPIIPINSTSYYIELVDKKENPVFAYPNFNLEVGDDGLWICDIGNFLKFDANEFENTKASYYYTLDNEKIIHAVKFEVSKGKYLITIFGSQKDNLPCFSFKLQAVSEFNSYQDPRENEVYDFNIQNLIKKPPFDIEGIDVPNITSDDILQAIRDGRERHNNFDFNA